MDADSLRHWLDQRAANHEFSGVALVWRDRAPAFSYAGGLAHRGHGVAMTEQTRFAVASVTKMVTATTALRLVDRGAIRLDQPLVEILPAGQRTAALTPEHTVHHLLSHTSGLPNYHDDEDETWDSFTSAWDRVPTYHVRRPADMLPLFQDLRAVQPPGAFQYADANFILASLVIEAAAGKPFVEAATDEVLRPVGMTDSAFDSLDLDPPRLATGYLHTSGPFETWRSNIFSVPANGMPDGGLVTTAVDLARLIDALLAGELVSPPTLAAMTSAQGRPPPKNEKPYGYGYGYGLELVIENGEVTILGHGGADPGVSTVVAHHRAAATTIVVLCNHDRGSWRVNVELATAFGLTDPRA